MSAITVSEAAALLGISRRMMYSLAAPIGPVPCHRFGRRIVFQEPDVLEYQASCRLNATRNAVRSSLSSTAVSAGSVSGLESAFRALGIKPRLTHSTGKNQPASTRQQQGRPAPAT